MAFVPTVHVSMIIPYLILNRISTLNYKQSEPLNQANNHFANVCCIFPKWGLILFLIAAFTSTPFGSQLQAQQQEWDSRWYLGFQGGVVNGSLNSSGSNLNITTSRFFFEENFYPAAGLHIGFSATEFERIQLSVMTGRFSLSTDHEFWPDLRFTNQFETATLSTQLSLRRLTTALPPAADLYGVFGFGVRNSNQSVVAINESVIPEEQEDLTISNDLSLIFTLGAGLNVRLSNSLLFFLQYDYSFSNQDVISSDFAGQILNNDFIQTTNQWGSLGAGIRIRFGSSRSSATPAPDFVLPPVTTTTVESSDDERETVTSDVVPVPAEEIGEAVEESEATMEEATESSRSEQEEETVAESASEVEVQDATHAETEREEQPATDDLEEVNEEPTVEEAEAELRTEEASEVLIPETEEQISEVTEDTGTSPYGLYGTTQEPFSGYTFSIYSFTSTAQAEQVRLQKTNEGLRSNVVHAVIRGVDYYRVVIGLFPNLQQARNEINNLPEPYRSNHFIIRVGEE